MNYADEIQVVLSMSQTDDFVRTVTIENGRVPNVILYRERQLQEIRAFCFDVNGSVWAFDKTFNLGSMYVTVSTYTNLALNRIISGNPPVFLGPLFIHGQSDFDSYNIFFHRLASKLSGCNTTLRLGSDDELAMKKSLAFCFHGSSTVACYRHLQQNTIHYAQDVIGMSRSDRTLLVDAIFGDTGLTSCDDAVVFEDEVTKFMASTLTTVPEQMKLYFTNR